VSSVVVEQFPVMEMPESAESAPRVPPLGRRASDLLRRHWHLLALLALTAAGGFFRFAWLTRPCLWGDEIMTFSRVCGTYREFLDVIQKDGFVPLHYSMYWAVSRFTYLTPRVMRSIPAAAGTLMIPAIYFLAQFLVSRRTALLAAAFTAVSAYMMVYSHDAKMYMQLWLFVTLNVGCLMWWFQSRRRVAWLCWVASGLAMVGLHAPGMIILGLQPLFLITRIRPHWSLLLPTAICLLLATMLHATPLVYYIWGGLTLVQLILMFLAEPVDGPDGKRRKNWKMLALLLIGMVMIGSGPAGYYLGFNEWRQRSGGLVPEAPEKGEAEANWGTSGVSWVEAYQSGRSDIEMALNSFSAYLFSWEWPKETEKLSKDFHGNPVIPVWIVAAGTGALAMLSGFMVLGMLPWPHPVRGIIDPNHNPQPWWRNALWLGMWIIIPAYGFFYCRSVSDFSSPVAWLEFFASPLNGAQWIWAAEIMLAICVALLLWRPHHLVPVAILIALAAGFVAIVLLTEPAQPNPGAMQYERAIRALSFQWLTAGGIVLLVPFVWYYSGHTLRERINKLGLLLFVVAIVFGLCFAAYAFWAHSKQVFIAAVLSKNPGVDWHPLWDRHWQAIWMPRYLGVIWPAIAIAIAALFMRLPTRTLRGLAIGVLLSVNLAQAIARMYVSPEPPLDRQAADLWQAHTSNGETFTSIHLGMNGPAPGQAGITSACGTYFLLQYDHLPMTPDQFRHRGSVEHFPFIAEAMNPRQLKNQVSSSKLRQVIIWENVGDTDRAKDKDPYLNTFPAGWRLVHKNAFPIWDHWSWQRMMPYYRYVYEKTPAASTTASR
jgi:hypothetical protein